MQGLKFPSKRELNRFLRWFLGRIIFCLILFSILLFKNFFRFLVWVLEKIEKDFLEFLNLYNGLIISEKQEKTITIDNDDSPALISQEIISKDILTLFKDKHCLIIGDTGSGKSTITQYLASYCNRVKIYDPDATIKDWQGLQVYGRGGDFKSIQLEMDNDLLELKSRIKTRSMEGDAIFEGRELCLIAEEFPALKDEIEVAPTWLGKIARRGRKPKIFLIILSQSENVRPMGIDGDGAVKMNFRIIRLGKFAVSHAKKLKNPSLVQWLKDGKYRCLCEDDPVQLPDLSLAQRTSQNNLLTSVEVPEVLDIQEFQDTEVTTSDLKNTIIFLLNNGKSETFVIENILNCRGRKFEEGKIKLREILDDDNCKL